MNLRALAALVVVVLAALTIKDARASRSDRSLTTQKEKVSYALGVNVAKQLRTSAIDIDPEVFDRGLKDALFTKSMLTEQEVNAIVAGVQKEAKARRFAAQHQQVRFREDRAGDAQQQQPAARLGIMFKLDPRLVSGVYGSAGDRWVSPPKYVKVGEGKTCAVEVKAISPPSVSASPKWTAVDPDMVTITPSEGNLVRLLVQRSGQTHVRVTAGDQFRVLTIAAGFKNNVLQVEISQD
jgi:hypothetical protein